MIELAKLLQSLDVVTVHGWTETVSGIHYDSRRIQPGMIFVAREAVEIDGHLFINSAIRAGAAVVVCEHLPKDFVDHPSCCFVVVPDSRRALAVLSASLYDHPASSLRLIGITGTNGKTTCTFLLKQLLEACGCKVGLVGTTGHFIANKKLPSANTTPEAPELQALLSHMVAEHVDTVVMEVSSHALDTERVYGLSWQAAVFTNLSQDHLDYHQSMDHYAQAKKKLFDALLPNSLAIVQSDDAASALMVRDCTAQIHAVGRMLHLEMQHAFQHLVSNESLHGHTTSFGMDGYLWQSPLVGSFNVDNLSLCLCCCLALGYDPNFLLNATSRLHAAPGRMESIAFDRGIIAVVDYAHSPDALEKTLKALRSRDEHRSITCVFGAGGDRDRAKRPLMGAIAEREADTVIVTNDNPRTEPALAIVSDIVSGMHHPELAAVILDREEAILAALRTAPDNAVVLVAGKGHEEYQIIGNERFPFSDREIISRLKGRSPQE